MSFISLGTSSSLSSKGIMAKPPTANREPAKDTRFKELRSWGNAAKSDHLDDVNTQKKQNSLAQYIYLFMFFILFLINSLVRGDVVHLY